MAEPIAANEFVDHAIQQVEAGTLPVLVGGLRPSAMILHQDGMFRIRALVVDPSLAAAAAAAAGRARTVSWMPSHYYAVGQPTGAILAEAESREGLIELMRTMTWPEL